MNLFGVSRETVLGNVVRNLHAKFHRINWIRKCFQIGKTKSLLQKQKPRILVMERFWYNSKSRKDLSFLFYFEMLFSATYLYCSGESINNTGKGFLHWKSFHIDFEKCHFGKLLLSDIYSHAIGAIQVFLEKIRMGTAIALVRTITSN